MSSAFADAFGAKGFVPPEGCENDDYGIIPNGWYSADIEAVEVKDTKKADGKYLKLTIAINSGEHEGRKVWDNINFLNSSPRTQAMGQRDLGRLTIACGFPQGYSVKDENEYIGKFIDIKVGYKPAKDNFKESNTVEKYAIYGSETHNKAVATPAGTPPAPPVAPVYAQQPIAPVVPLPPATAPQQPAPVAPPMVAPQTTAVPAQPQQPAAPVQPAPVPQLPVAPVNSTVPPLPWGPKPAAQ